MISLSGMLSNEEIDPVALPDGWAETTLDKILYQLESGSRPIGGVRNIKTGIPSIGGEHLNNNGGFRFDSIKFVPLDFYQSMSAGHIQIEDILIVKDGATTGKVSLVRNDFPYEPAVVNEHVFICRPSPEILSSFIFYYLFSGIGQNQILQNFRGSAQGGINQGFTHGTSVPIAPYTEQKRIVAKVEEFLDRINMACYRLDKVPKIMKHFRQAVLAAACSGKLTEDWRVDHAEIETAVELIERIKAMCREQLGYKYKEPVPVGGFDLHDIPKQWKWVSIDAISTKVVDGVHKKPAYVDNGIPFITVRNLTECPDISFERLNYISEEDHLKFIKRANPEPGDILVTKDGTLGVVRAVRTERPFSIFVSVALVKPVTTDLTDYLEVILSSPQVQQYMIATGSGLQHIHLRDLKRTCVPIPSLSEQREIVRRVEVLFNLADAIEMRIAAATVLADKLTQSILAKAFRGELVPPEAELARQEGRDYEPASELLKRIAVQREAAEPKTKGKRANR